jgi:hypothetical protein
VLAALADGDTEERARLVCDDNLRFLGGTFLLPAVVAPLFFGGRARGLSATSTTITSMGVPPARNCFLPGPWHTGLVIKRFSILCTVRHTTDSSEEGASDLVCQRAPL